MSTVQCRSQPLITWPPTVVLCKRLVRGDERLVGLTIYKDVGFTFAFLPFGALLEFGRSGVGDGWCCESAGGKERGGEESFSAHGCWSESEELIKRLEVFEMKSN